MPRTAVKRRTQRERSEATVEQLLATARERFAQDGYQATSLDEIVGAAGMTKGALYHHFSAGKPALFRAIFEREQMALDEVRLAAYRRKRDPWEGLYASCRAFFEASLDPGVQRITLLDAPAVLGWEEVRAIQAKYSLSGLQQALEVLVDAGRIAPRPVEPLAFLLQGAICEGAMMVARSSDQKAATRQVLSELRVLLDSLTVSRS